MPYLPRTLLIGLALLAGSLTAACRGAEARKDAAPGLSAFRSDAELRDFLKRVARRQATVSYDVAEAPMPAPPPAVAAPAPAADIVVTSARATSITNNQEQGVDEGDIVKQAGDILVVLRRGRLFTIDLARGGLRPVDAIDAYPPGTSGEDSWYDEMLLLGDRVVVVGYSYARGGTEINRFRLSRDGRLRFEDAHHLRSNDYYSSRNYASRLIGNRLVFYTPLDLGGGADPLAALPAVRRWTGRENAAFRRIADARHIFIAPNLRRDPAARIETLHSVTRCDLASADFACTAEGVLGASSRTFYVAPGAVYLWVSDAWTKPRPGMANAFVYRIPLDGGRPAAIGARGGPVDQFSFRESRGTLDVLVRAGGGDDAMWRPEVTGGGLALLSMPVAAFGDGSRQAARSRYRPLPGGDGGWQFHNRFVGDFLLYGSGTLTDARRAGVPVYATRIVGGATQRITLPHGFDRIEPVGADAMVIGNDADDALTFSTILLGRTAVTGDRYRFGKTAESENRSHAFFYRPDPDSADGASGLMGLPAMRSGAGSRFVDQQSAAILFLNRRDRRLAPAGEIAAAPPRWLDDGCRASCVDWYGNARPIFIGSRVFALMGYELVEGRLANGRIDERARIDFSPVAKRRRSG